MRNKDKIIEKINLLSDLDYLDWVNLEIVVDRIFEQKKKELENKIEFPNADDIKKTIYSIFE